MNFILGGLILYIIIYLKYRNLQLHEYNKCTTTQLDSQDQGSKAPSGVGKKLWTLKKQCSTKFHQKKN